MYLSIFDWISTLGLIGPTYFEPRMLLTISRLSSILVMRSSLLPRMVPSFYLYGIETNSRLLQTPSTFIIISVNYAYFAACTAICTISSLNLSTYNSLKYFKLYLGLSISTKRFCISYSPTPNFLPFKLSPIIFLIY